ncbi:MAG: protein kinase [Calditrichia bacterium]
MIGQTVSHYRITKKLGVGGMGVVYKAEDTRLNRTVALKFLPPELTLDPEAKARFIREAQAASALEHPNICNIHEIDETSDGQLFIVMACYEGETLKEKIKEKRLKKKEAIEIAIQIARGLQKAHEKGIVHRDIKPANIFITTDGQVKILDFGLAKLAGGSRITRSGSRFGTVCYMSPEQIRGEAADQRSDIWSLGVLLYEMLTGQLPFDGEFDQVIMYSILSTEARRPGEINPDVPPELDRIIQKTLTKDPDKRYQKLRDLLDDIRRIPGVSPYPEKAINLKTVLKSPKFIMPVSLLLVAISIGILWWENRNAKIRWAIGEILPQIEQKVEGTYLAGLAPAYDLALLAQRYIPDNPKLLELIAKSTVVTSITSEPPGANVYLKEYNKPEAEWKFVGITPVDSIRLARDFFRFRFEKNGYGMVQAVELTFLPGAEGWIPIAIYRALTPDSLIPVDMVRIPGAETVHGKLPDFFLDKFEVTNKQFKIFIDNGGYANSAYWKYPFIRDGKELTCREALELFKDASGRPGPATWQAGDYPEGQDNFPVTGISWYEAAAYAEFAGKKIPTITHWRLACGLEKFYGLGLFPSYLYPMSNFKIQGANAVGSNKGETFYGNYDMAGNAREWCFNETYSGSRCICGGAWDDAPYVAENITHASAFDRSPRNGFRCALYMDTAAIPPRVFQSWPGFSGWDYEDIPRVSDEVFQIYRDQFSYNKEPLDAQVDTMDSTNKDWIVEKVLYNTAYNNERMYANLYLPRNISKPFQIIVYFPGTFAFSYSSVSTRENWFQFQLIDFIIKNGRAVIIPAYKGTYGRKVEDAYQIYKGRPTRRYVEYLIQVIKDFRRTIDFLESRPDIDSDKIAFYGFSWGGLWAPMITSVEDRLKVSVLPLAGLRAYGNNDIHPAGDPLNYVSHVHIPTLILSGKYDIVFPYGTVVKPIKKCHL